MCHIVDLNNISCIVFSNPKMLGNFVYQKYFGVPPQVGTYELFYKSRHLEGSKTLWMNYF
jgi:hypothetical protein